MKKLSILLLLPLGLFGQSRSFSIEYELRSVPYFFPSPTYEAKVIQAVMYKPEKKDTTKYFIELNDKHFITKRVESFKNREIAFTANYGEEGIISSTKKTQKKNFQTQYIRMNGKPFHQETKDEKNTSIFKQMWKYQTDMCISEQVTYGKNERLRGTWKFEYESGCVLKRSYLLNRKGKLVKSYTFECKSEGEIVKPVKQTTQVCSWTHINNQQMQKVTQNINQKGKITKFVEIFTIQDSLPLETKLFVDDKLQEVRTFDKSYKKPLTYTYYRKGKERWKNEYVYIGDLLSKQCTFTNGKKKSEWNYTYTGSANELIVVNETNQKDKVIKISEFQLKF